MTQQQAMDILRTLTVEQQRLLAVLLPMIEAARPKPPGGGCSN